MQSSPTRIRALRPRQRRLQQQAARTGDVRRKIPRARASMAREVIGVKLRGPVGNRRHQFRSAGKVGVARQREQRLAVRALRRVWHRGRATVASMRQQLLNHRRFISRQQAPQRHIPLQPIWRHVVGHCRRGDKPCQADGKRMARQRDANESANHGDGSWAGLTVGGNCGENERRVTHPLYRLIAAVNSTNHC